MKVNIDTHPERQTSISKRHTFFGSSREKQASVVAESVENHLRSYENHEDRKRKQEPFPFKCDNHHAEGVDEEDTCPYEQNGIDRQYSVPKISHKGIIVYPVK